MSVFKKPNDYSDWGNWIASCETIVGLSKSEKKKAKNAFKVLKYEFGDDFLEHAITNQHPFLLYLANSAPWTRRWMIWFAKAIQELKRQENSSNLLCRLRDRKRFEEALSVLGVAYKFSKAGFGLSFDPSVDVSGRIVIPDLKLINEGTKEELYAEISVLTPSMIEKYALNTIQTITDSLWHPVKFLLPMKSQFEYCGIIHKTLSKRHLDEIVGKIESMVKKVEREGVFRELIVRDAVEIGAAPVNDKQILRWAERRGIKVGELRGPTYNVNEVLRTKRTIQNEQKQLPPDYPNILIVRNTDLFFRVPDIRKAISELEEEAYEYPHLITVIVSGQRSGRGENVIARKDQHMFIQKSQDDLPVEQYIILLNKFLSPKVSPSTISKIYDAFRNW